MTASLLRMGACVGLAIAVALFAPDDPALRAALAIFALAGSLWMTQALPLTLTALLVPLLAVLFAAFCALASFGIGNLSQLNSIAGNLKAAFGVPEAVTGAVLAAVSAVILLGGLKRVAAVAGKLRG